MDQFRRAVRLAIHTVRPVSATFGFTVHQVECGVPYPNIAHVRTVTLDGLLDSDVVSALSGVLDVGSPEP